MTHCYAPDDDVWVETFCRKLAERVAFRRLDRSQSVNADDAYAFGRVFLAGSVGLAGLCALVVAMGALL